MHDTETASSPQIAAQENVLLRPTASAQPAEIPAAKADVKPRGLLKIFAGWFRSLFSRRPAPVAYAADPIVAERAAVALSHQMEPPVAFRGDTTNTLASPMGTYAGKPAQLAMRKRAEQQFKNLDTTTATMN